MKKNLVFKIHAIAGLVSGLFLLALSISGSALIFREELDQLQFPTINIESNRPALTVDSCYAIIQRKYPNALISNCSLPEEPGEPFLFSIYDSAYNDANESMQLFVHPQNGEILKTRGGSNDSQNNFLSWLSSFHNSFKLHKKGEWLLGVFAILFIISLVTGLILYRKNIFGVLLFRKNVLRKNNLHQVVGVWALLFNLMIAFTGFWMQRYVFKKEFYNSGSYTPVIKRSPPLYFDLGNSMNNLQKDFPGFSGYVIYFSQSTRGKTAIYGSRKENSFIHSKKFADVISLDSTGAVANTRFIDQISAEDRFDIINSQVHFGRYGGWPIKILYSLLGLTGALLSITGFVIWWRRKK